MDDPVLVPRRRGPDAGTERLGQDRRPPMGALEDVTRGVIVISYWLLLVFPAAMAFAAMMDLFTMTIPNRISLFLVAAFLLVAPLTGMPWEQFGAHLATGAAVLAVGIVLFAFGIVGGGDAKLLAAAALWIGHQDLLPYCLAVAILAGVLSVVILLYRGILPPLWLANKPWAMRLHDRKVGVPYGLALSGAALWVFPTTAWFAAFAQA